MVTLHLLIIHFKTLFLDLPTLDIISWLFLWKVKSQQLLPPLLSTKIVISLFSFTGHFCNFKQLLTDYLTQLLTIHSLTQIFLVCLLHTRHCCNFIGARLTVMIKAEKVLIPLNSFIFKTNHIKYIKKDILSKLINTCKNESDKCYAEG